jgi:acyl-coenzyme A thioesterase PaaI-like protein
MSASRHWLHARRAQGDFVRSIVTGTGCLRSEGRVIHVGSRLATAEARLTDGAGKLHAHAVGTCLVVAAR